MTNFDKKIGFIGAGNMGQAFMGAIVKSGFLPPEQLSATDVDRDRLQAVCREYGIRAVDTNYELFITCDVVVLAVKPQQIERVLCEIADNPNYRITERKLVISIAAGVTLQKIEASLYTALDKFSREILPLIRVMPNTPALVLAAVSGMSANRNATSDDIATARNLLAAIGTVVEFQEAALDAVTGLSGSGPAYVFYLAEAMIEAGITVGLKPSEAATLTLGTLKGAIKLLESTGESPELLRQKVTSPGGTTAAALEVFETRGFKAAVVEAIAAATRRAGELSQ